MTEQEIEDEWLLSDEPDAGVADADFIALEHAITSDMNGDEEIRLKDWADIEHAVYRDVFAIVATVVLLFLIFGCAALPQATSRCIHDVTTMEVVSMPGGANVGGVNVGGGLQLAPRSHCDEWVRVDTLTGRDTGAVLHQYPDR